MTHIGELAITGVLLNAVKTSWVCIVQGRTQLTKCRLFLHTYHRHTSRIARVAKLQQNMEW